MITSVWDLKRNDVDGAVWVYEHLPLASGELETLVLLQDDPTSLFERLRVATKYSAV